MLCAYLATGIPPGVKTATKASARRDGGLAMNLDLSEPAEAWLVANVDGYHCPGRLEKFSFGQSNPTYKLSCPGGRFVLRRKPSGQLLPKAHAIERECRVLKALEGSPIPIPHMFAYCADAELVGAPFYVMDFVDGRIFYDQRLPGMTAEERGYLRCHECRDRRPSCSRAGGLGSW